MIAVRRSSPSTLLFIMFALAAVIPPRDAISQQLPPRPSPAVAYQRLDSLEQAALTGTTFAMRLHAASTITSIARGQGSCVSGPEPSTIEYPGLVRRLASVYRRSEDASLRRSILNLMLFQVECDEAVAFLTEVAEGAPQGRFARPGLVIDESLATPQSGAVSLLLEFGPRGESALRRLHSQGTVRDSFARSSLESFARNGFRLPRR